MKVKELAIMVLMITIMGILSIKVEATTGKINSETVRLRKEPNTNSTILEQLDKNKEVEILEQENGWYKIKTKINGETITGYVSETLVNVEEDKKNTQSQKEIPAETTSENNTAEDSADITTETNIEATQDLQQVDVEPTTKTVETTTEIKEDEKYVLEKETIIKALPLVNSRTRATISGDIKVIEVLNDWCRVENDKEIGWVRIGLLKTTTNEENVREPQQQITDEKTQEISTKNDEQKQQTTSNEEQTQNEKITNINKLGYVNAEGLIVRKEPTTSSDEIDSLSRNDKVEIIGKVDGWYQINLNGKKGYVSSKYISDTKTIETTSRGGNSIKAENITPMEGQETTETEETSKPTDTETTEKTAVVEYAKQYLGYRYVPGGGTPSTGFDCSGFTSYVYKHFGISLSRTSKDQAKNGTAVEKNNLQLGDILIFNNTANTAIGHVGIYIGDNNFIHASNPSEGVKITSLSSSYYKSRYVGARRVI